MKKYAYIAALATTFIIGGCSDNSDNPVNPEPEEIPVIEWKGQRPATPTAYPTMKQ